MATNMVIVCLDTQIFDDLSLYFRLNPEKISTGRLLCVKYLCIDLNCRSADLFVIYYFELRVFTDSCDVL